MSTPAETLLNQNGRDDVKELECHRNIDASREEAIENHILNLADNNIKTKRDMDSDTVEVPTAIQSQENHHDKPLQASVIQSPKPKSCFEEVEDRLEQMFAGIEDEPNNCESKKVSQIDSEAVICDNANGNAIMEDQNTAKQGNKLGPYDIIANNYVVPKNSDIELIPQSTVSILPAATLPPAHMIPPPNPVVFGSEASIETPAHLCDAVVPPPIDLTSSGRKCNVEITHAEPALPATTETLPINNNNNNSLCTAVARTSTENHKTDNFVASKSKHKQKMTIKQKRHMAIIHKKKNNNNNHNNNNNKDYHSSHDNVGIERKNDAIQGKSTMLLEENHQLRELGKGINNTTNNEPLKHKSPFIEVKREGVINVINAPIAEEINEKQTKMKKSIASGGYSTHGRKQSRGWHSSTLSNKYDANTTDSSWICVFCKRGPHRMKLGDLFGPYIVTSDCDEYRNAIKSPSPSRCFDDSFSNKRRKFDMIPSVPMHPFETNKKIEQSNPDVYSWTTSDVTADGHLRNFTFGLFKLSDANYEIWLHEDCAIWAPGVYLVGSGLFGLAPSIWNSIQHNCVLCEKSGATVCCLQRDCKKTAHVPCAQEAQWHLEEETQRVFCNVHSHPQDITNLKSNLA